MIIIIGFVLSIIASVIGAYLFIKWEQRKENHPLRQLLNFGDDELLFVFSHRDHVPEAVLPRTSTEDFLAMNNIISALLKIGWRGKLGVRDTTRLRPDDKKRNLITVCGPKSNSFTKEVLDKINSKGCDCFRFEKNNELNQWQIVDSTACYPSHSYEQIEHYQQIGKNVTEQEIDDVAMIAKVTNPWNAANKILIIGGVRGFGTWGAAECLKKAWKQIYNQKSNSHDHKKNGDFAAVLAIKYNNCDIIDIKLHTLKDFS